MSETIDTPDIDLDHRLADPGELVTLHTYHGAVDHLITTHKITAPDKEYVDIEIGGTGEGPIDGHVRIKLDRDS